MILYIFDMYNSLESQPLSPPFCNDADSWAQFYTGRSISPERIADIQKRHTPFLDAIIAHNPQQAIEIGIGTGVLGHSLKEHARGNNMPHLQVTEVDFHTQFLHDAAQYEGLHSLGLVGGNAFDLPFQADRREETVIFHQGFLEHFSDDDIKRLLCEQLRVASCVLASVPSSTYCFPAGLRGDERLMTIEEWQEILPDFDVQAMYYGENAGEEYHICLSIREKTTIAF